MLPADFDIALWTKDACLASGVPLGVEDVLALRKIAAVAGSTVMP